MSYKNDNTIIADSQVKFSGSFPKKPKHACESSVILTGNTKQTKYIPTTQRAWRDRIHIPRNEESGFWIDKCEACFYEHCYRIVKQIEQGILADFDGGWGYITILKKRVC